MTPQVQNLIDACEWASSSWLIFSDNVFVPLIYYSHLGVLIPMLFIGTYILLTGRKELPNQLLFLMALCFSIWIFGDLVLWATEFPSYTMTFWSLLVLIEPFVYFFAMYFAYVFLFKKDIPTGLLILFSIPLWVTVVIAPTNLGLTGFSLEDCERAAYEGMGATYGYVIEGFYTVLILIYAITAFLRAKSKDSKERIKILIFASSIILFLVSFSLGNILEVFTENWYIGQYGLFGAPVFLTGLGYLILKYKTFNLRLVGAQVLITALWFLLLSLLFVRTIESVRVVVAVTLVLVTLVGILLIRGVHNEVKQKQLAQKLATELAGANARLERLDKMKSEFVSIASHQLRSPLTSVRGYISMIMEGSYGEVPAKVKEVLTHVSDASRHMALSIEDYLNVSRIEAGNMKYEITDYDLKKLAEEVVVELLPVGEKKGIKIELKPLTTETATVKLDIGKTRQIVQNLIDNALKYTQGNGSITVSVRKDVGKKMAYVDVTDQGIGISAEGIQTLFQKFERAKNANEINVTGTGLGLYIARTMAREMNGDITVTSPGEGKGSTFTLSMPLNGIDAKWGAPFRKI